MAIIIFKEKFMNFDFIGAVFIIIGMVLSAKGRETIK
jgi:drug/metabolite transporter (DMT)-like permease